MVSAEKECCRIDDVVTQRVGEVLGELLVRPSDEWEEQGISKVWARRVDACARASASLHCSDAVITRITASVRIPPKWFSFSRWGDT